MEYGIRRQVSLDLMLTLLFPWSSAASTGSHWHVQHYFLGPIQASYKLPRSDCQPLSLRVELLLCCTRKISTSSDDEIQVVPGECEA